MTTMQADQPRTRIVFLNSTSDDPEAHRAGCGHIEKADGIHIDIAGRADVLSKRDARTEYNLDFIDEVESESDLWSIRFAPCLSDLPDKNRYDHRIRQTARGLKLVTTR